MNDYPIKQNAINYHDQKRQLLDVSPCNKLIVECINNTAIITLDNPPVNTLDAEMLQGIATIINRLNNHKSIYNLIITGQDNQFFSAGTELSIFAKQDFSAVQEISLRFSQAFTALKSFKGVSIAAINGYAMGSGLELAIACDTRICEKQSVMALPETSLGLIPCGGSTQSLTQLVGPAWAKRIILCCQQINSEQALKIGLVEEIANERQALNNALSLAFDASKQSPLSVAHAKELIEESSQNSFQRQLQLEHFHLLSLFGSNDQQEGTMAFFEKRTPIWGNEK